MFKSIVLAIALAASLVVTVEEPKFPGQLVDIKAGDYFFQAPATIRPGLTTIRFTSVLGNHLFQLYRLDRAHSPGDLVSALTANKAHPWATNLGGVGAGYKGKEAYAIFMLEPGKYALVCPVHAPDLKRHYMKGMYSELTVSGKRVPGILPSPVAEVTASEWIWKFSAPIKPGRGIIRFTNAGTVPHQLKFVKLESSVTENRVRAWKVGQPPVPGELETIAPLDPGGSILVSVMLIPGDYVLWCIPQMAHGMLQPLRIKGTWVTK